MNAESYWQQFLNSGKVEDYLSYSRMSRDDVSAGVSHGDFVAGVSRQDFTVAENRREQEKGENPYAGSYYSDGNDLKSDAYR